MSLTWSSRPRNGVQATAGSSTCATGASQAASSFCTPLMFSATAIGAPGTICRLGCSTAENAGPWPTVAPSTGTSAPCRSQRCTVVSLYFSMSDSPGASCLRRMKYSVALSALQVLAPYSARSTGPAMRAPVAASYTEIDASSEPPAEMPTATFEPSGAARM